MQENDNQSNLNQNRQNEYKHQPKLTNTWHERPNFQPPGNLGVMNTSRFLAAFGSLPYRNINGVVQEYLNYPLFENLET